MSCLKFQVRSLFKSPIKHNSGPAGSNVESVEVTKEAVMGMSGPTFYYAQVREHTG